MLNVTSCNYESREIIALGNFPTNFLLAFVVGKYALV